MLAKWKVLVVSSAARGDCRSGNLLPEQGVGEGAEGVAESLLQLTECKMQLHSTRLYTQKGKQRCD